MSAQLGLSRSAQFLCLVLLLLLPLPSRADPVLGGRIFASGGDVEVEVLPAEAGSTSELLLLSPPPETFIATNRDVGLVVPLGSFPAGVELIFAIRHLPSGNVYSTGPGERNPDGVPHAIVDFIAPGVAEVGFEDLYGGGDQDYNDNRYQMRGQVDMAVQFAYYEARADGEDSVTIRWATLMESSTLAFMVKAIDDPVLPEVSESVGFVPAHGPGEPYTFAFQHEGALDFWYQIAEVTSDAGLGDMTPCFQVQQGRAVRRSR